MIRRRNERADERAIHAVAKGIHLSMKDGTLDDITSNTFSWINGRLTAAEREALQVAPNETV